MRRANLLKKGYHLFTDNFYTKLALADTVEREDPADRNCMRKFEKPASSCYKDECGTGSELPASGSFDCCLA